MLPLAAFTTESIPPRSRYEIWRGLVAAVFEPSPPSGQSTSDMRARVSSAHLGGALVVDAMAQSQHFTRSRRLIATEGLDHYLIQVYRRGICEGTYGTVQNTVRPGDIKVIDLSQPFHTLNTDFDNTTLTIPRPALAPLLARPDAMHGLVLPREGAMARVLAAHIDQLSATAGQLSAAEGAALVSATVRLVAACLGPAERAHDETLPYRAAAIGQAIRDHIEQNVAAPTLGPDLLTRRFRISRTQMYRLFAEDGGVAAYIQQRRLEHCFRAIVDPAQARRGIGEIAFSYGFTSEAHFSRSFRRAFGAAPSEARAGALRARPVPRDDFLNDWMRGLRGGFDDGLRAR